MHLTEETIARETIWNAKIFTAYRDTARLEDNTEVERDVIAHSGGVCVLPLTDHDTILMVKQFRYPMQEITLEIPAGKREEGETPLECGRRELHEELGIIDATFTELGKLYPTPAYDTEVIYMYLATNLKTKTTQSLDRGEFLDITEIDLNRAFSMVQNGEFPDAKTQLAILKTYLMRH